MRLSKNIKFTGIACTLLAILAVIYFNFDPATSIWFPKCPVKIITGFDCPGCGSQRLFHGLLHGDFRGAWKANPFIFLTLPYISILIFISLFPRPFPRLAKWAQSLPAVTVFLLFALLWTIIRNNLNAS